MVGVQGIGGLPRISSGNQLSLLTGLIHVADRIIR